MSKEHPILFSTSMVQAILEGRKTQTRRIVKIQPDSECYFEMKIADGLLIIDYNQGDENPTVKCPYGKIGDVLWVRETFLIIPLTNSILFKADNNDKFLLSMGQILENAKWKPSIFMPRAACRIFLQIINIRVERLQDISPGDACDEGINYWNIDADAFEGGELGADFENYMWKDDEKYEDYFFPTYGSCIHSYQSLWEKINGAGSWQANPFVWVIEFKKLKP